MSALVKRRDRWRVVLAAELEKWSAMTYEQLASDLREAKTYEISIADRGYQVEVQLLEKTPQDVHVLISVDDGTLPLSIVPVSGDFIREKNSAPLK